MRKPLLFGLLALISALAGAQGPVLSGRQITESALVEALATPDAPPASDALPASDGLPKLRGFKPGLRSQEPARTASSESPRKASLLIAFETDSAVLTQHAKNAVDIVGRALQLDKLARLRFTVEGHADPRGGEERNYRLSKMRAEAVVAYLVEQHHIAADRLTPLGKGSSELMNTKNPEAAENRRVSIVTNTQ